VAGTLLLVPLWLAVEAAGPHGPDSGGGVMLAYMLWLGGSVLFGAMNLILLVRGIVGQLQREPSPVATPIGRAVIGCALPFVIAAIVMEFA
jgi:hypothetical protein